MASFKAINSTFIELRATIFYSLDNELILANLLLLYKVNKLLLVDFLDSKLPP